MPLDRWIWVLGLWLAGALTTTAQGQGQVSGRVSLPDGNAVAGAQVWSSVGPKAGTQSDRQGRFTVPVEAMPVQVFVYLPGYKLVDTLLKAYPSKEVIITLVPVEGLLDSVTVIGAKRVSSATGQLGTLERYGLYAAKKSEVITVRSEPVNLATNNPRQLYARVPGLNIWESDGAGLQLGIGGRGLSPNRTSNFNTRQNGYDIAADPLGYPESYYTPPAEALDRIEIVRGAGALQYGSQFGGMVNFRMRQGPTDTPLEIELRQAVGSWRFLNTFGSVGGQFETRPPAEGGTPMTINYFGFYQSKRGDGWRPNSSFSYDMAYGQVEARGKGWTLRPELTWMSYLAQQPGGLTDAQFAQDPTQSNRARNWFQVGWLLPSLEATLQTGRQTSLSVRAFGLSASRSAVGVLDRINVADLPGPRDLIVGEFYNMGVESRLAGQSLWQGRTVSWLAGVRTYRGLSRARQGRGTAGSGPEFMYLRPDSIEGSDFTFPNLNLAAFAEVALPITERLTLVPGVRLEYIDTRSRGVYAQRVLDRAGNEIAYRAIPDNQNLARTVPLGGLGLSYRTVAGRELYANVTRNYRAVNFTDVRIANPSIRIDTNLRDERGWSADLGLRDLRPGRIIVYDVSVFWVEYANRIGLLLRQDPRLFIDYRLRTNVARARNQGVESYAEIRLDRLADRLRGGRGGVGRWRASAFVNASAISALYVQTREPSIRGRQVELVPPVTARLGVSGGLGRVTATALWAYTGRHYSDATNAVRSASAVNGVIPAYAVADLSIQVRLPAGFALEGSINNIFNRDYFTRRADAYPGPGIIPADRRNLHLALAWRHAL